MGQDLARLKSGVPGLDDILDGGLIEGASYIIQGRPGAGKTILSNQMAFAQLGTGRRVLYVTLLAETHDRLFQSLSTLDFFDRSQLGADIAYLSVFQALRDEGLSAVVKLLRREIQRQKATLLVFDGLLNARDRAHNELDIKTFVAEVQSQAAFVGCTVLFLTSTYREDTSPEHTMVDGVIDLCDELVGVRTVRRLQILKSRGSDSLGGYHQFRISDNGIIVYPRLEAIRARPSTDSEPDATRMETGLPSLDALICGGLPRGSSTLVLGASGSGKTSLGLNFLNTASAAEPALYFGFYETPARLLLKARSLQIGLERAVERSVLDFIWNPLTENLLDELGHQLLETVHRKRVKRLFIDSLSGFERAASRPGRLIEFFAALMNELRALGVTVISTWELREMASPNLPLPSPEICSVLDNLILLRQVEVRAEMQRVLAVLKMRDSAFNPMLHEFEIDRGGLRILRPFAPVENLITGPSRSTGY